MAKKSEFDHMEGQQNKQIDKVKLVNGTVQIAWRIEHEAADGETEIDKGSINLHEPPTLEFKDCMAGLYEHPVISLINNAGAKMREQWKKRIRITEVCYNHNSKGITAGITGYYETEDGKSAKIDLPAVYILDQEIEAHASGVESTYTEHISTLLTDLMHHAKLYLGGQRGPMQQTIPVDNSQEEAA